MASSTPRAACSRADRSAVSAGVSGPGRGRARPPKFTIMVVARLARLPRSLARSALRRPTKRLLAEARVQPEGHLAQEEVAEGVVAVLVRELKGLHDIADGLGHLPPPIVQ